MTPEEIRKLAEEYAEDATKVMAGDPNLSASDLNGIKRDIAEYAEEVIRFILRTHCIVSKEEVEEIKANRYLKEYEFLTERCIEDLNPERMDWHDILRLCDGMYYALKQLLDETDK